MGANFTPTFGAYSPLTPFRYWCQKVLPLVYDDSLSYYECLNKTVDYLNKTMEDVETLHGDTEAMLAAFNQLQTYVNTYFDELDLTEEVQTVLDRMAENGSLDALLRPIVGEQIDGVVAEQIDDAVAGQIYNTVAEQINAVVAEQISGAIGSQVSAWLDENVEPSTGYVIDKTLTIENAAADAKEVGDRLLTINNILYNEILDEIESEYTVAMGAIDTITGNDTGSLANSRARTTYIKIGKKPIKFFIENGWEYRVFKYNATDGDISNFLSYEPNGSWYSDSKILFPDCEYIRICIRKADNTAFTLSNVPTNNLTTYTIKTDETLTDSTLPANAKAVGDRIALVEETLGKEINTNKGNISEIDEVLTNAIINNKTPIATTWAQGALDPDTGRTTNVSINARARSFYILMEGKSIKIKVNDGWQYRLYLYREQLIDDSEGYLGYIDWSNNAILHYIENKYIRIVVRKSDNSNFNYQEMPDVKIYEYKQPAQSELEREAMNIGLHTIPNSTEHLNVIKRVRQLTDIKWTADYNVKRISLMTENSYSETGGTFSDVFLSGKEYAGLPYSRASFTSPDYGHGKYYIGGTVNLESFISSLHYPNSGVATLGGYDASNSACYYGTTCATLMAYAFDEEPYATTYFSSDNTITLIGKLINNDTRMDANMLQLCDILGYVNHHGAIITDIVRENDVVKYIEVSESTKFGNYNASNQGSEYGGICRRKLWPIDDFYSWFRSFNVYRRNNFEGIKYNAENIGMEINNLHFDQCTSLPCIPFMGNKFNYIYGYIPNSSLLVSDISNFTHIIVTKDNVRWNSNGTQNRYNIDSVVDLGFTEPGEYTACLVKVNNDVEGFKSVISKWNVCRSYDETAQMQGDNIVITCKTQKFNKPRSVFFGLTFPGRPCTKIKDTQYTATEYETYVEYTINIPAVTAWSYSSVRVVYENDLGVWASNAITL